ncbi:hypothetical protein [Rhizobium sp. SL42]|uniref:hypothetical protein n=1 Tax=Rhizobium sp. SL42 TaxID=2806346 RepID=UPI001F30273E|nr:hypothetical protein [Rhizobium sp. SL42]UJW74267.1 hypothetical protein IM739_15560 [Rhizobium sp. SL42]
MALTFGASAESPVAPPAVAAQSSPGLIATQQSDATTNPTPGARPILPLVSPAAKIDGDKTGSIGGADSALIGEERRVLIGLLFLCFAVMAIGGYGLWRRSFKDLIQSRIGPDRH